MSEENVELVRRYFPAYEQGGLDAWAEFWHPDISWRAAEGALDDVGVFHGHDAMRRYYRQWEETFDEVSTELEELIVAGIRSRSELALVVSSSTALRRSRSVPTQKRSASPIPRRPPSTTSTTT